MVVEAIMTRLSCRGVHNIESQFSTNKALKGGSSQHHSPSQDTSGRNLNQAAMVGQELHANVSEPYTKSCSDAGEAMSLACNTVTLSICPSYTAE